MNALRLTLALLLSLAFARAAESPSPPHAPDIVVSYQRAFSDRPGVAIMFESHPRKEIARLESKEALLRFVATLKAGQRIHWHSGCLIYKELTLGPDRLPLDEVRSICAAKGVTFTYEYGGP